MYHIEIKEHALKEIGNFPHQSQLRIMDEIDRLTLNPRPHGAVKLQGFKDRWRIRIGDYRILYTVNDTARQIYIYRILHRKDVYR